MSWIKQQVATEALWSFNLELHRLQRRSKFPSKTYVAEPMRRMAKQHSQLSLLQQVDALIRTATTTSPTQQYACSVEEVRSSIGQRSRSITIAPPICSRKLMDQHFVSGKNFQDYLWLALSQLLKILSSPTKEKKIHCVPKKWGTVSPWKTHGSKYLGKFSQWCSRSATRFPFSPRQFSAMQG